jgi:hypothetical protein
MTHPRIAVVRFLIVVAMLPIARAQTVGAWEYLVVAYATPSLGADLADVGAAEASRSKVRRFADLGIPLPQDATALQRNIDLLGRFGWELVAVVGTVDEGRRMLFKRPFDEERSAREAELIRTERAAIVAQFDTVPEPPRVADPTAPELVDLDALDRAQALEDRGARAGEAVRAQFLEVHELGFPLSHLDVEARIDTPEAAADLAVRVVQDVTNAALVGTSEYRSSLALGAYAELLDALEQVGLAQSEEGSCPVAGGLGTGRLQLTVDLAIRVGAASTVVATRRSTHCFVEP